MAGVRLAAVTTIGLVTVAAIIGGDRFGGLGQFITEGLQTYFDTKIYLGALARSSWRSSSTDSSSPCSAR